jgi:hypothetical protein
MSFVTNYSAALIELESGGWDDIPDQYVLEILNSVVQELIKRDYDVGCNEYVITDIPVSSIENKIVEFGGVA